MPTAGEDDGDDAYGLGARAGAKVKAVADKTFLLRAGRPLDRHRLRRQGRDRSRSRRTRDAWTALLAQGEQVAKYLALGEKVVVVVAGKAYEIVPAKAE